MSLGLAKNILKIEKRIENLKCRIESNVEKDVGIFIKYGTKNVELELLQHVALG